MTVVLNDPSFWPIISSVRELSYAEVASFIVLLYDCALTFGQEFELIWMQDWSLMTVLYLIVRYMGIPYTWTMFLFLPSVSVTDTVSTILYLIADWMSIIASAMLGAIVIVRLHAMYQRSRKVLIFLVVFFLAIQITCIVIVVMGETGTHLMFEEYIFSGTHLCIDTAEEDAPVPRSMTWAFGAAWEVLALCFAVWIAVKHVRELQRPARWAVGDCFTILMRTHVFYFASFVLVSCLKLSYFSPKIIGLNDVGGEVYDGVLQIAQVMQMFMLGPRLILGVRKYHADLVAKSDEGSGIASIVFQERIHITTGDGV